MGQRFVIESLTIHTDETSITYDYAPGVNVVIGPIGSGKSSMLELIKYGLGGRARVMPAVRDNVRRINLKIRVGSSHLLLTRELHSHTIEVVDLSEGGHAVVWATTQRKHIPRAGEELLGDLGLPRDLRIPRRRTRPNGETVLVSFYDVYRYLYLDQNSIDDNIVGHNDTNLNTKRIAVFELLYGLTNPRIVELATERGRLLQQAQSTRDAARNVHDFLRANNEPDPTRLQIERHNAEHVKLEAEKRMKAIRFGAGGLTIDGSLGREIATLRAQLAELETQSLSVRRDIEKDQSVLAQLDLDEAAAKREESAGRSLSGLEFTCCPRCLQSVQERSVEPGSCLLCRQELPAEMSGLDVDLLRIKDQRKETEALLQEDLRTLENVTAEVESVRERLGDLLIRAEIRQAEPPSPVLDEVADLSRRAASASARIQDIMASQSRWASYERLLTEAEEASALASRLKDQETLLRLELEQNSTKLTDLSVVFNDILSSLRDPWYHEAYIDPESYLPMVDGEPFDLLSVGGGRKTLVNLAYHLANLSMSLSETTSVLMPTLLVIDSPRKNVGEGGFDRDIVEAVYRRLRTLQDAAIASGEPEFQIIIADNEPPQSARDWLPKIIELDYVKPLVPGVIHPGQDVQTLDEDAADELT